MKPLVTIVSVLFSAALMTLLLYQFGDFDLKGSLFIGVFTALLTFAIPQIELYWKKRKGKNAN